MVWRSFHICAFELCIRLSFRTIGQNRLNEGSAVRSGRLVSYLVSDGLSLYTIITTALALVNGAWGLGPQQANVQM